MALPMCHEGCFQNISAQSNRAFFREIYNVGMDLKRIKNVNGATGLAFLIDNSLGYRCRSSSSDSSIESFEDNLDNTNGTALIQYQLQLMAILSAIVGNIRVYPVQFTQAAAKGCIENECMDDCMTIATINANRFYAPQINRTSCNEDSLEPACRLAYFLINNATCTPTTARPNSTIAVAILNSDAHSHVHRDGDYANFSPCVNYFPLRYALGIHQANHDDLRRFGSRRSYHNYVTDSATARVAATSLYNCVRAACCTAPLPTVPSTYTCSAATGHTGEFLGSTGSPPGF